MNKPSEEFSKIILKTQRLILRPYLISDFDTWAKVRRERLPKQTDFDRGPPDESTITKKWLADWIKKSKRAQDLDLIYSFGIFDKKSGENYGMVTYGVISRMRYQFANLGYELNNQFFGNGYATEAVKASLPIAFKVLKLHRVEAGIQPGNKASIAVAKNAGLKYEGLRKKYAFDGNTWVDLVYYTAIAEDFGMKNMKPTIHPEWQV